MKKLVKSEITEEDRNIKPSKMKSEEFRSDEVPSVKNTVKNSI